MRSKPKKFFIIMMTALMFIFPVIELPGWRYSGISEVYAAGGMDDCGKNLSAVYGDITGILSIQVKDKSDSSNRTMSNWDKDSQYPWHSKRSEVKSISINSGVENIGNSAFKNMTSLTEVYLPKSMTVIFPNAFEGCTQLKTIYYGGSYDDWQTLQANIHPGNDDLKNAIKYYGDAGEMSYDFCGSGGGTHAYNGLYNGRLRNTFAVLENNDLITWDKEYAFSNLIDLNKDGTNDISCYFSKSPSSYSLAALQTSDLMGQTYTFEIDKDMDLIGVDDNDYQYYSKVSFKFPPKFNGDKGSFTLDLVNNNSIKDEEFYCLGVFFNAANKDSSIICHFSGPVTEVDLDKDGAIDVITDATNYPNIAVAKAGTCSVKDPAFTVKLSAGAKDQMNKLEEVYYSTVTFKLSEPEKPAAPSKTQPAASGETLKDIYGNVIVTAAQKEKQILSLKNDKDSAGSTFNLLQAKQKKVTKNSIKLAWKKVKGATSYIIYGNKCGNKNHYKKLTTVTGTSYTQKKLKKGTYYKYLIVAVGDGKALATSKTLHVATSGGKAGNAKSVKVNKTKVTIKKNKTFTIKATSKAQSAKLKIKNHRKVAFETSNPKVATVNSKGKIKGVGKGSCKIYAYAQNGAYKVISVKVR